MLEKFPSAIGLSMFTSLFMNRVLPIKAIANEREKLNYKQEFNLSDTKVKINLKEILRREGVPFKNNAKLKELQTSVLNTLEIKSQESCHGQQISSDIEIKSPPSGKDIPFTKCVSGKLHPPKKFKLLFSPIKKSSGTR